nr:VEB-PER [uncultured bacterium]
MKKHLVVIVFCALFASASAFAAKGTDSLKSSIEKYLKDKKAKVGVAILGIEDNFKLNVNEKHHYPMQSTYKFHLALAVLDILDKENISVDKKLFVKKSDLLPDTWSPLRDKYPNGNLELSFSEIIKSTVSHSDNNGCDILFRFVGGTNKVHNFISKLGVKNISIKATEEEMHKAWNVQYTNWTTPDATVQLLKKFYKNEILSKNSYDFLLNTMIETTTGPKRLKGLLPDGTVVAHKTGSSDTNDKGITAATNDIGIITLPNGKHFAIAVYVSDSSEKSDVNEKIIAEICKSVWDYLIKGGK